MKQETLFSSPDPRVDPDTHHCHAKRCTLAVPPERLMCGRHWAMVPKTIQRAVWAHYREGQCVDKKPSEAWMQAAHAAIGAVAQKEGHPITTSEALALADFHVLPKR